MIFHCLSPNSKCISSSKCHCHINHCNCSSECICLTNYCSPCSKEKSLQTNLYNNKNQEKKITYEIDSKEAFSPKQPLRKNQSLLLKNISPEMPLKKTNSLFNIREKIYNENKNDLYETKKYGEVNKQNILSKCCSMNFVRKKRPCINKNWIRNNIDKKNELMEKIKYISNRIDQTINLYIESSKT